MKYTQIGCFRIADAFKDSKIKESVKERENKDSALWNT